MDMAGSTFEQPQQGLVAPSAGSGQETR